MIALLDRVILDVSPCLSCGRRQSVSTYASILAASPTLPVFSYMPRVTPHASVHLSEILQSSCYLHTLKALLAFLNQENGWNVF